jgi:membrane protein DedA with SNARE-associated domain
MLGSVLGYWIGRRAAAPVLARLVSPDQRAQLARLSDRFGVSALIVARPVPVLAEASVILAGAARMRMGAFLGANAAANLAVAGTYAVAGSFSASSGSVLLALAALLVIPGAAVLLWRRFAS